MPLIGAIFAVLTRLTAPIWTFIGDDLRANDERMDIDDDE